LPPLVHARAVDFHRLLIEVDEQVAGDDIDHADRRVSGARIGIGPGTAAMTHADIVETYNDILDAQCGLLHEWDKTVVEEPPGEKQIDYHENSDQWVPRGDVLRCIIDDGGPNGEVTIHLDDQELSLAEFGRLLSVHAGWGISASKRTTL
jgi:hypothetical protein